MEKKTIFNEDGLACHLFRAPNPRGALVYTFTERGKVMLDQPGFGVEFLTKRGYDVAAIKSSKWLWYENLTSGMLAKLRDVAKGRAYQVVSTYGSSMGGYAALRFAKELGAMNAFALSPIATIKADWDKRWRDDAENLNPAIDMFPPSAVGSNIKYMAVYDNFSPDRHHIEVFEKIIGSSFKSLRVPYSGHPVGPSLKLYNQLEEIATGALSWGSLPKFVRRPRELRLKSEKYLFNTARYLVKRNRSVAAYAATEAALRIDFNNPEYHMLMAKIYRQSGLLEQAILAASRSAFLGPDNPNFALYRDLLVQAQIKELRKLPGTVVGTLSSQ